MNVCPYAALWSAAAARALEEREPQLSAGIYSLEGALAAAEARAGAAADGAAKAAEAKAAAEAERDSVRAACARAEVSASHEMAPRGSRQLTPPPPNKKRGKMGTPVCVPRVREARELGPGPG